MAQTITRGGFAYAPPTTLQTPYQTPGVDRTPTAPRAGSDGTGGVEADWSWSDIPWRTLGQAAKGALEGALGA